MSFIVKNFMSKDILSVAPELNAKDALKALIRSGRSGLPVIDKSGKVLGVFTEKEILKSILPAYLKDVGSFVYGQDSKSELNKLSHLDRYMVKDIMRTEVPTVTEDTSLTEVSHIMPTRSERRLMVTADNKAVGIITRSDVVKALAKEAGLSL